MLSDVLNNLVERGNTGSPCDHKEVIILFSPSFFVQCGNANLTEFLIVESPVRQCDFYFVIYLQRVKVETHDSTFGKLFAFMIDFDQEFEGLLTINFRDRSVFSVDNFLVDDGLDFQMFSYLKAKRSSGGR